MKEKYCFRCGKHVASLNTPKDVGRNYNVIRKGTVLICKDCISSNNFNIFEALQKAVNGGSYESKI